MFGNFLGICTMLRSLSVDGLFLSTFPLAAYFENRSTIKFGKRSNGEAPIIYDKATFDAGSIFWTQCSMEEDTAPDCMRATILSRMQELLGQLEEGDALNLYLIGHGGLKGVLLGSKVLYWQGLSKMLAQIQSKAQVNVFAQSCRSGALIDLLQGNSEGSLLCNASAQANQSSYPDKRSISGRHRNSPFTLAFSKSLKFCFEPESVAWTLSGHNNLLTREGGTTGKANVTNLTTINLQTALNEAMFAEVDCRAMISPSMVRRILTPTNVSTPSRASTPRPESFAQEELDEIIHACEAEIDLLGECYWELDNAITTPIYSAPHRFTHHEIGSLQLFSETTEVLHAFRWRCSVQLAVLRCVGDITKYFKKSTRRLRKLKPISWDEQPAYISVFIEFLESFPALGACTSTMTEDLTGRFPAPVCWLAVILTRFRLRPLDVLILLEENGTFGSLDLESVKETRVLYANSKLRPKHMVAKHANEHAPQVMFWLPDGTETEELMRSHMLKVEERVSRLKAVYENMVGPGSWGLPSPAKELADWI